MLIERKINETANFFFVLSREALFSNPIIADIFSEITAPRGILKENKNKIGTSNGYVHEQQSHISTYALNRKGTLNILWNLNFEKSNVLFIVYSHCCYVLHMHWRFTYALLHSSNVYYHIYIYTPHSCSMLLAAWVSVRASVDWMCSNWLLHHVSR